jgi:hypothetical protein
MKIQPLSIPDGYKLRIHSEVPVGDAFLYRSMYTEPLTPSERLIIQGQITREFLMKYLSKIPDIGEVFSLPYLREGIICWRI